MNPKSKATKSTAFSQVSPLFIGTVLLLGAFLFYFTQNSRYSEISISSSLLDQEGEWMSVENRIPAPSFDFKNMRGEIISLEQFRSGKPLLLVFWRTDCAACKEEFPRIQALQKSINILALSVDPKFKHLTRYLEANPLSFNVGWDEGQEIARRYGVRGVPFCVLVDSSGKIAYEGFQAPDSLEKPFEAPSAA